MKSKACSNALPLSSEPGLGGTRQAVPEGLQEGCGLKVPWGIYYYFSNLVLSCMKQSLHHNAGQPLQ